MSADTRIANIENPPGDGAPHVRPIAREMLARLAAARDLAPEWNDPWAGLNVELTIRRSGEAAEVTKPVNAVSSGRIGDGLVACVIGAPALFPEPVRVGIALQTPEGRLFGSGVAAWTARQTQVTVVFENELKQMDRRRHARHQVRVPVSVTDPHTNNPVTGVTSDLSEGGVGIAALHGAVVPGDRVNVCFGGSVIVPAIVIDGGVCESDGTTEGARIQFVDVPERVKDELSGFIHQVVRQDRRDESGKRRGIEPGRRMTWGVMRAGTVLSDGRIVLAIVPKTNPHGDTVIHATIHCPIRGRFITTFKPNDVAVISPSDIG